MRPNHTPQSEYLVGWAINRMWQLQIDHPVMVTVQVAYLSRLSWSRRVVLDVGRFIIG
jgi:hypothetical protein